MNLDPEKARSISMIRDDAIVEVLDELVVRAFNAPDAPYCPTVHCGTSVLLHKYDGLGGGLRYERRLGAQAWYADGSGA